MSVVNKLLINNRSCEPDKTKGTLKSHLTQQTWRSELGFLPTENPDLPTVASACVKKGSCWDKETAAGLTAMQISRDPWLPCYTSKTPWSIDTPGSPSENLAALMCHSKSEKAEADEIARVYFSKTRTVMARCFSKIIKPRVAGDVTEFFIEEINFDDIDGSKFLKIKSEGFMLSRLKPIKTLEEFHEFINELQSRSNPNACNFTESQRILLYTISYYIIKEFPEKYGLKFLVKAVNSTFAFFRDNTTIEAKKQQLIDFFKTMRLPNGNMPEEVIESYISSLNDISCLKRTSTGSIDTAASKGTYDCSIKNRAGDLKNDENFLLQCIVPSFASSERIGRAKLQTTYECKMHPPPQFGTGTASPTFETHQELLDHIRDVHGDDATFLSDAMTQRALPAVKPSSVYDSTTKVGIDAFWGTVQGPPLKEFSTLAFFMVNALQSRSRLSETQKYLSYLFLLIYTFGHEAGHHTIIAEYYSILDMYGLKRNTNVSSQKGFMDADNFTKLTRIKPIFDRTNNSIGLEYIEESNPHNSMSKSDLEQEGVPDIFGFMLLEYVIKTNAFNTTDVKEALLSFYGGVCPSKEGAGHPAGVIRANLIKTSDYLFKIISPPKKGGKRSTRNRRKMLNKSKKNRR